MRKTPCPLSAVPVSEHADSISVSTSSLYAATSTDPRSLSAVAMVRKVSARGFLSRHLTTATRSPVTATPFHHLATHFLVIATLTLHLAARFRMLRLRSRNTLLPINPAGRRLMVPLLATTVLASLMATTPTASTSLLLYNTLRTVI